MALVRIFRPPYDRALDADDGPDLAEMAQRWRNAASQLSASASAYDRGVSIGLRTAADELDAEITQ